MSRFSLLLALCLLGVSMAAAHHDGANMILVCPGSTCNGYNSTYMPAECTHRGLNATLATCTSDVYGANTGYAMVFCADNQAHVALFGNDATCNAGSLQKIVSQESGVCVQSTLFDCTGVPSTPLPEEFAALQHVTQTYCQDDQCQASCATTRIITDKCALGLQDDASKFTRCNNNNGAWETTESTWKAFQGPTYNTCPSTPAANSTVPRAYGHCQLTTEGPSRYGNYVRYGCGHQDLSAASFTAPAFTLLAALAAAMLALTQ